VAKPKPIEIIVGETYSHRGRKVVIAYDDSGGIWLSPIEDGGKPFFLPWHRLGELKPEGAAK
jgi:hypothetical protein